MPKDTLPADMTGAADSTPADTVPAESTPDSLSTQKPDQSVPPVTSGYSKEEVQRIILAERDRSLEIFELCQMSASLSSYPKFVSQGAATQVVRRELATAAIDSSSVRSAMAPPQQNGSKEGTENDAELRKRYEQFRDDYEFEGISFDEWKKSLTEFHQSNKTEWHAQTIAEPAGRLA